MKRIINISYLLFIVLVPTGVACSINEPSDTTTVSVSIPAESPSIDPMIYGQMLEHVNDRMIYDGILNKDGTERPHVTDLLKPLHIPVIRWPGGTFVHEYDWETGIGPIEDRPTYKNIAWGGIEPSYFGTDEFLQWANKLGAEPYINLNMSTHPILGGTLKDALNWIEYVNGPAESLYGKRRAKNGHRAPYNVKFWGIGNENWGSYGVNIKESESVYAQRLFKWAKAIRADYPNLKLIGVGHTYNWDKTVLKEAGSVIDFLTQHYYVTSKVKDGEIQDPEHSIFAPAKVEAHLEKLSTLLDKANSDLNRKDNPIRLSIDEWNNRHFVNKGEEFDFTRQDARRQFDIATVAGMLNVFIRQSPTVGMANYIFPVNAHGLVRTVGDDNAFKTAIYFVFERYRNWMTGKRLKVKVDGPGLSVSDLNFSLDGDADEINMDNKHLNYIDAAAVQTEDKTINVALVNRSSQSTRSVKLNLSDNYAPSKIWKLAASDISSANTANNQNNIKPVAEKINTGSSSILLNIPPAGLYIIQYDDSL